jgi:ferric iron reductase protein FhuF
MPARQLLQPETMAELLELGRKSLKGLGLDIAVSFFGLAFFGVPAAVHTFMFQYNHILDLSLDNLTIQLEDHGDHAHLNLIINEVRWRELPAVNKEEAIVAEISELFRHTVTPMIEAAASCAGLKPDLVWNQFGSRMISVSDFVLNQLPTEPMKMGYRQHLNVLANLSPELFNRRKNPYVHTPRPIESAYKPGEQVLIRSSCCMWYRRENGVKCYTCPNLNETQREQLKCQIREKQSTTA